MECSGQNLGDLVGLLVFRQEKSLLPHKVNLILQDMDFQQQPLCHQ